jgi:2-polyprenyl-3-methyl-5-hydroxy-6-metoxy-1,4-benzoquinol methylase
MAFIPCPICLGKCDTLDLEVDDSHDVCACSHCQYAFIYPIPAVDSENLFSSAYRGQVKDSMMEEFNRRLQLREEVLLHKVDTARLLTNEQRESLTWLCSNMPRGARVLDVGTGPGYFLRALESHEFNPLGLDVAEPPVKLLRNEGYQVWLGTVATLPSDFPQPAVCTVFNILHHIPFPMSFLSELKTRFPNAVLMVGQYDTFGSVSESKKLVATWFPPRTYNYWSPVSLRRALEKAGYKVEMASKLKMTSGEYQLPGAERLYLRSRRLLHKLLPLYYALKPLMFAANARLRRSASKESENMLAIGRPI